MITAKDLKLILQKPQHFLIKIEILKDDGKTILDTLKGIIAGGTASIDSSSSVRRTFSISLIPTLYDRNDTKITEDGLVWLNKELKLYVGVMDIRTKNIYITTLGIMYIQILLALMILLPINYLSHAAIICLNWTGQKMAKSVH